MRGYTFGFGEYAVGEVLKGKLNCHHTAVSCLHDARIVSADMKPGSIGCAALEHLGLMFAEIEIGKRSVTVVKGFTPNQFYDMCTGTYVEKHPNGNVALSVDYVKGKQQGIYLKLNPDGTLVERRQMANDLRHGMQEYGSRHSERVEQTSYLNNKLHGARVVY